MILPLGGPPGLFGATAPAVVKAATAPTNWLGRAYQEALKQIPRVIQVNMPSKPPGGPPIMPAPFPPPSTQSNLPQIGKDPYGGLREAPKKPGNMMGLLLVGVAAMFLLGRK